MGLFIFAGIGGVLTSDRSYSASTSPYRKFSLALTSIAPVVCMTEAKSTVRRVHWPPSSRKSTRSTCPAAALHTKTVCLNTAIVTLKCTGPNWTDRASTRRKQPEVFFHCVSSTFHLSCTLAWSCLLCLWCGSAAECDTFHFRLVYSDAENASIFERSFNRTLGLARLLVLERLPTTNARQQYMRKRRAERGRPDPGYRYQQRFMKGNIKDDHEDEVADWADEAEVSNYHTFTIPYGPRLHAKKIEKLCYTRDLRSSLLCVISLGQRQADLPCSPECGMESIQRERGIPAQTPCFLRAR